MSLMERSVGETDIGFAGSFLGAPRHVCALFHNRDQEVVSLIVIRKNDRGAHAAIIG
jgi:hypothetical protein